MAAHDLQLDLSINLGNNENDAAIQQALSSLELETVVKRTLQMAGIAQPVMLTLLITTDDAIRALNMQYRRQDKVTDVLSFPLLDNPIVNAPGDQLWTPAAESGEGGATSFFVTPPELVTNLGDIVISWPTVVQQASKAGHDPNYELLYLLSHGVLHLIGYDDQTEAGYQAMIQIQQAVIEELNGKHSNNE